MNFVNLAMLPLISWQNTLKQFEKGIKLESEKNIRDLNVIKIRFESLKFMK